MKKKIIFTIISFFALFSLVLGEESILGNKTVANLDNLDSITHISYTEKNILIATMKDSDTYLTLYDNEYHKISTKKLTDTIVYDLQKINETFYLVTLKNNNLYLYNFDTNLHLINSVSSNDIITASKIKLNYYDNQLYLVFLTDADELYQNEIPIYDSNLTFLENKRFSEFSEENLINIFKENYYQIKLSSNIDSSYYKSILTSEYLVTSSVNEMNIPVISLLDKDSDIIWQKKLNEATEIIDFQVINNKIVLLTDKELALYDFKGNLIQTMPLDKEYRMLKVIQNNLALISNETITNYALTFHITQKTSIYGKLTISNTAQAYEPITFEAVANSGYNIKNVIIKDEYGNLISEQNNQFIMPASNITIEPVYEETITNPNTADINILLTFLIGFIFSLILIKVYHEYKWLK
mgnify:FL=1